MSVVRRMLLGAVLGSCAAAILVPSSGETAAAFTDSEQVSASITVAPAPAAPLVAAQVPMAAEELVAASDGSGTASDEPAPLLAPAPVPGESSGQAFRWSTPTTTVTPAPVDEPDPTVPAESDPTPSAESDPAPPDKSAPTPGEGNP